MLSSSRLYFFMWDLKFVNNVYF
uniref:Histone-lysine n-methyltransferase setd1 n=1 Tax=Triatoma infestans TaxID=30076 RepID=A0A161N3C0_TRIIF